ncbi:MAG: hypothetical protein AABW79_00075 [Nanoarchaeota archaeon]
MEILLEDYVVRRYIENVSVDFGDSSVGSIRSSGKNIGTFSSGFIESNRGQFGANLGNEVDPFNELIFVLAQANLNVVNRESL